MGRDKRKWSGNGGGNNHNNGGSGGGSGGGGDDDSDVDERAQYGDSAHAGSFTLDEVKASVDYAHKVDLAGLPKKKYAVNFGYVGTAYQGLQINPGADSVEKHLERALFLAGGIDECNWGCLAKVQWSRTARTDRGVHAVTQCCAMKLLMDPNARQAFIDSVNGFLPHDIRVHAVTKVTKSFNGKLSCSGRRYEYLLPTYMLQDADAARDALEAAYQRQGPLVDVARPGGFADAGSDRFLGPDGLAHVREQVLVPFRIDGARLANVREALKCYEGTRMYHNFTTGKTPSDSNAKRYITSFTCSDPFVHEASQVEWVVLAVEGQSFLLNQIRKMVGLACEIASGNAASVQVAQEALTAVKVEIPMAPGLGLYLDQLHFAGYNNKLDLSSSRGGGGEDGVPSEKLDWKDQPALHAVTSKFKENVVWPHIMKEEQEGLHFLYYLDYLRVHPYRFVVKEFNAQQKKKPRKEEVDSSAE